MTNEQTEAALRYATWRLSLAQQELAGVQPALQDNLVRIAGGRRERAARHLRLAAEALSNGVAL